MQTRAPGSIPVVRPEPIIKVDAVAHVMFEKPDLDALERFLVDFGLVRHQRSSDALYMRGTGGEPYIYAASRGASSRFVGIGFRAASRLDLETLARATNTPIEKSNEPGGGERVRLRDPAGFTVDVLHGTEMVEPLPARSEPLPPNTPGRKVRINQPRRPTLRPAQVVRLGHVVLQQTDFDAGVQWYMRHLGLIPTDVQCLANGAPNLAFMRLDRGDQPADHHTVVVFGGIADAYGHSAYEVVDLDEVGMGQQVLLNGGWKHVWGIGRHILGSQIFDYWKDPFGDEMEHYADGDVFDASYPTGYHSFDPSLLWMWGDDLPADFGPKLSAGALAGVAKGVLTGRLSMEKMRLLKQTMAQPARPWLARR